ADPGDVADAKVIVYVDGEPVIADASDFPGSGEGGGGTDDRLPDPSEESAGQAVVTDGEDGYELVQLADVATSGSYSDLSDTPTLGTAAAADAIDFAAANHNHDGTYVKPSDLGTAVGLDSVDEDDMESNSATLLPTQQSVKAYVDTTVGQEVAARQLATPTVVECSTGSQPPRPALGEGARVLWLNYSDDDDPTNAVEGDLVLKLLSGGE